MRISKVKIKNFRSFGPEETIVDFENLTTIIGANSSGKTSLLMALLKMFGEVGSEREISRSDFHVPKGIKPKDINESSFSIEAVFEFPELGQEGGKGVNTVPVFFENFVVNQPGEAPYLRILLEANWKQSSSPEGVIDYKYWYLTAPEAEALTDECKKPLSNADKAHIKIIYVPAIRNPSSQLKNASGTLLWRVLRGINWSDSAKQQIADKIGEVEQVFDSQQGVSAVQKAIKKQWKDYHRDHRYTNATIKFNSTDLETILKKVDVEFSPTVTTNSYSVDELGEGLRSLFYLSLVGSLLEIEDVVLKEVSSGINNDSMTFRIEPPALTIVAVEEPENHISPQLLGKVVSNLKRISLQSNSQVILTSHTPSIVKRVEPTQIRHFKICKDKLCTVSNKMITPQKAG